MKEAIETYKVLVNVCNKARDLSLQNKKYIADFGLPIIGKAKKKNDNTELLNYFDQLHDKVLENTHLELIASFEAKVVKKVENASGEMTKNISSNYSNSFPFQGYESRFVKNKDDVGSLDKILELLKNKITQKQYNGLNEIVKYRNRLAHGKRFNNDTSLKNIDDTHDLLVEILDEIG